MMNTTIEKNIKNAINLKQAILADKNMIESITKLSNLIVDCYKNDGKVLFCGNGGSAADAQHLAAELSGRYYYDRPPLFAEALHVNTSFLTAVANDYSFDEIYARMVKAMGRKNDVLIGLSTSGNSQNVINALMQAKELGMITVGFTGEEGGKMKDCCDIIFKIPSKNTPRIQECHMLIGHSICEFVEQHLFPKPEDFKQTQYEANIFPKIDKTWTLFLDRDGVINRKLYNDYVKSIEELELLPNATKAITNFSKYFGRIIIVTNQQGISKGLMTENDLIQVHKHLLEKVHQDGGKIDAIYHAPQLATAGSTMRKPEIGMALKAKERFPEIDFKKSIMIGDSISDMEFGERLNMTCIYIHQEKNPEYYTLPSLDTFNKTLSNILTTT